jgi:hypothetical protein
MPSRLTEVSFDGHDLEVLVTFWSAALGYVTVGRGEGWIAIGPAGPGLTTDDLRAGPVPPNLAFCVVPEARTVKNRVHIDITPINATQQDEVERLLALGATRIDVGQVDVTWVVLADPEGNEFCVMSDGSDSTQG